MTKKKKTTDEAATKNPYGIEEITLTAGGEPLPLDPETGEIDAEKLTDEQRQELKQTAEKVAAALNRVIDDSGIKRGVEKASAFIKAFQSEKLRDILAASAADLRQIQELFVELDELEPFIKAELKKEEYQGKTFDDILEYTPRELQEQRNDPGSYVYKAFEAAKKRADIVAAQQKGRETRRQIKENAEQKNAVMSLKNYFFFSEATLWDAFAPGRICKMGTLSVDYIDEETGRIDKTYFDKGEIDNLEPADISLNAFSLLNTIRANTVNNLREEPIEDGKITFYVKGVLDGITDDPRTLLDDDQIAIDLRNPLNRKTAGMLYLEQLFEPLQGYIGTLPNGSRYKVFNYIGYDFESDTMTIQLPYLTELWKLTQAEYFQAQERKQKAIEENKRPKKADLAPLKVNALFKNRAYSEDPITLEIAVAITNVILTAGNVGRQKKTEIKYKTLINSCARFKAKLEEIESGYDKDGNEIPNPAARYNDQLKKIARAFDLIHNPEKCDALQHYEFIDIRPAKMKEGKLCFESPTKRKLDGKITIVWRRKPDDDLQ